MEVGGASPAPETWSKPPAGPSPSGRAARRRLAAARCEACGHTWTAHPGAHEPVVTRCLECAAQGDGDAADPDADVEADAAADVEPCRRRVPRRVLRRASTRSLESSAPWHVKAAHRVKQVLGEAIEAVVDALTNPF
ncbi:hypothetical protein [Frigoribacterium sp. CFBP 13707]|uniref:hypothetical protein n=1 Tax=Frigoribacterium sp. CFBP 13707 TaxID=2775313 RepID=UPI001784AE13|nr:hypothetical protein [Frigoribacterium sp. CFBP 13707]MBD8726628.1 hypothetical protein [Frigoribacterium sp. CFBP 13707]